MFSGDSWFRRRAVAVSLLRLLVDDVDRVNIVIAAGRYNNSSRPSGGLEVLHVQPRIPGCARPMPLSSALTRQKLMTEMGHRRWQQTQHHPVNETITVIRWSARMMLAPRAYKTSCEYNYHRIFSLNYCYTYIGIFIEHLIAQIAFRCYIQ